MLAVLVEDLGLVYHRQEGRVVTQGRSTNFSSLKEVKSELGGRYVFGTPFPPRKETPPSSLTRPGRIQ